MIKTLTSIYKCGPAVTTLSDVLVQILSLPVPYSYYSCVKL